MSIEKRLISLAMSLILAMSMLTFSIAPVFAGAEDEVISNVDFTVKLPVEGMTVGQASMRASQTIELGSGVPYDFVESSVDRTVFIWKSTDGKYLDSSYKFKMGKKYMLGVVILVNEGVAKEFSEKQTKVSLTCSSGDKYAQLDHFDTGLMWGRSTLSATINVTIPTPETNSSLNIGKIGGGHIGVEEVEESGASKPYSNPGRYFFTPGSTINVSEGLESGGHFGAWFEGIVGNNGDIVGYKGKPFEDDKQERIVNNFSYVASDGVHRNICAVFVDSTDKSEYNVTFSKGEGGSGDMEGSLAFPGVDFTLPDNEFIAPENKVFAGWSVKIGEREAVTMNAGDKIQGADNAITATALWATQDVNVHYSAGEGKGETVLCETIKSGNSHTVKKFSSFEGFSAPDGYQFAGWVVSENGTKIPKDTVDAGHDLIVPVVGSRAVGDLTLTAYYEKTPQPDPDPGKDPGTDPGKDPGTDPGTGSDTDTPAIRNGQIFKKGGNVYKVLSATAKTAALTKAANMNTATVPATAEVNGETLKITRINSGAFKGKKIRKVIVGKNVKKLSKNALKGSKASAMIIRTKSLSKASVKGSLRGSKINSIKVKVGKKKENRKYVKKYKKIFTKKNAGRKVKKIS